MRSNHVGLAHTIEDVQFDYNTLLSKRCFAHWYLEEGLEEEEFTSANENLSKTMIVFVF